jgi:AraC family transcriptional regulator, regulatory protein of adaptative response / methylated-DNA-[protein]-cysteine methyltransferase
MLNMEQCWQAVQERDAAHDGRFVYGVLTTGVYCRPSCPSRRPLAKNVRVYESTAEAERDGLRACLRCRPSSMPEIEPSSGQVAQVCRYMESHSEESLKIGDLATMFGMSRFRLQRVFKSAVGLTLKQYLDAVRLKQLKKGLKEAGDVAEAVYGAGYGSSSRVYENADTRLGMTPNQYRHGGGGVTITHATIMTPLGLVTIGATDRGLCFLQFGDSRAGLLTMLEKEYPEARISPISKPHHADFQKWADALNAYLAGTQSRPDLPLDIRATAFQIRVWNYLQSIPYGEVQSYGEVAAGIGQPKAIRAVARACSANPVALVIPCHRVIRGTGQLGGYRWGLARKRVLIDQERAAQSQPRMAN